MFIEDGSKYDYDGIIMHNRYSWGWLGEDVPTEHKGWYDINLKQKVINRLKDIKDCVMLHRGHHNCEICQKEGKELLYGFNGSLLVDYNGKQYRSPEPNAIVHYIEEHDYNPGKEVIEMLFNGRIKTREEEHKEIEEASKIRIEKFKKEEENRWNSLSSREKKRRIEVERQQAEGRSKLEQLRKSGSIVE